MCTTISINTDSIVEDQESFLVELASTDQSVTLNLISSAEVFIQDNTSEYLV